MSSSQTERDRYVGAEKSERLNIRRALPATRESDRRLEAFIFSVLATLGTILLSVVLITGTDWFIPFMFYAAVSYVAWQRYFD